MSISDGQTGVGLIGSISATFSEPLDPSTVSDTTFFVSGRSPRGYVSYDEATRTASFLPDTLMTPETWHVLTITGDVADEAGNRYEGGTTSFQTGPFDCDHLLDHLEPNDDIADATPIQLDEWMRSLTLCEGRPDSSPDCFTFTVDDTVKVHARGKLTYCIEELSWITYFYRADSEVYVNSGTSASQGETQGWYYTFLPGTYWVCVHTSEFDPWGYVLYDFMLETDDPCVDDGFEDNDFVDESRRVDANHDYDLIGCMVDADWFRIDLTTGQTLTVTVTSGTSTTRRLRLLDPGQVQVAYYNGGNNPASVSYTALETGTHFFMTRFWTEGVDYEMNVVVD